MPRVTIQLVEGRTLEQKRKMADEITKSICAICNVPNSAVTIYFDDMPKNSYSKGGIMVCDENK